MVESGGTPYLSLCDGNGKDRIVLWINQDGYTCVMLHDGHNTRRLEVELDSQRRVHLL